MLKYPYYCKMCFSPQVIKSVTLVVRESQTQVYKIVFDGFNGGGVKSARSCVHGLCPAITMGATPPADRSNIPQEINKPFYRNSENRR